MRRRIGDRLIRAGLISDRDLRAALAEQARTGERLGAILVRLDVVSEWQVARTLAQQLGLAYVNLTDHPPDPAALVLIPREVASRHESVAVRFQDAALIVASADPTQLESNGDVESMVGSPVTPAVATRSDILRVIQTGYSARPRSVPVPAVSANVCGRCGGELGAGWRFCPFCASSTGGRPGKRLPTHPGTPVLKPAAGGFR